MFSADIWFDIDDQLNDSSSPYDFMNEARPGEPMRFVWRQYGTNSRPFLVALHLDENNYLVLSWGWEGATVHDAVRWYQSKNSDEDPRVLMSDSLVKEIVVSKNKLMGSMRQEIDRVAEFLDTDLKRKLEFAELEAAFDCVVEGWREYWQAPHLQQMHSYPEIPDPDPPKLEVASNQCVLTHGKRVIALSRDDAGWRVKVEEEFFPDDEVWRFYEETVTPEKGKDYIHSSDLVQAILDACARL